MARVTSKIETITPELALKYLEAMTNNRRVRQSHVDFLAEQMRAGLWQDNGESIKFDTTGNLADGQHRLWALIQADVTLELLVTRGVAPEAVSTIDTGLSRDYSDTAHYAGYDSDKVGASIAKTLVLGPTLQHRKVPHAVLHSWVQFYQQGVELATRLRYKHRIGGTKSIPVPVAAAIARASYTVDHNTLERFMTIVGTGDKEFDADRAAIALRDAILMGRLGNSTTEKYFKAQGAIRAFYERRPIRNLQRVEEELYTVPKLPQALHHSVYTTAKIEKSQRAPRPAMAAKQAQGASAAAAL